MKFTIERIENNIAICEYEENCEILHKEIAVSDLPFKPKEGLVFTAEEIDGIWCYKLTEADIQEPEKRKKRVRNKLNILFGRKTKDE
ncbi:MAG: DUF3006 domain-containing protein [Ruminococcaceae bacterium]|nr:DUF3006 domain-containing protein [Oscillospiraceae bacterium]